MSSRYGMSRMEWVEFQIERGSAEEIDADDIEYLLELIQKQAREIGKLRAESSVDQEELKHG